VKGYDHSHHGFFWGFCDDNHQKNNLTKFGYMLDMKVERKRFILYSCLPIGIYHQNQAIRRNLKFG
jgi:hypothetical protein